MRLASASSSDSAAPGLADRLVDARRVDRLRVALRYPSFVRHPVGPGWALVGDAGYYRDAITGHGITDAFRDAELLAGAVGAWLRGAQPETVAMHRYTIEREAGLRPIFDITNALAAWPGPEEFFGLQKDLNRLLDVEAERLASASPPPASTATAACIYPPLPKYQRQPQTNSGANHLTGPGETDVPPVRHVGAVKEIPGGAHNLRDTRPIFLRRSPT